MIGLPRLEPAHRRDAGALARLSRDLIEYGLSWSWRPSRISAAIRDPETEVVVARDDDELLGFSLTHFDFTRHRAHLALLAVVPRHRRRGLGGGLVEWNLELARRGGVRTMLLEVRTAAGDARAFYHELGWTETGRLRGYYQGREDALRMARPVGRGPLPDDA